MRGICEKPRIKCADCPNRRFLPVTDEVIRWHLSGSDGTGQPFVAGVHPLLQDETCFFLAVDFDKTGWRDDALAFLDTCRRLGIAAALERSRSGRVLIRKETVVRIEPEIWSVRRLVRDGVDTPLASLFLHATRTVAANAEGAERARSATEAFLFRRLESLPETRGRFQVNGVLPIAFDGTGTLEVDLVCAGARVAVELDGAQHLADPTAYRRDRRKDQLLQENGYLVLRFLAEDVGKELDMVLDAIVRAVVHRAQANVAGPLRFVRRSHS